MQSKNKNLVKLPAKLRTDLLKEYRHQCARCRTAPPEIHCIDENLSNNDSYNFIPLCPNCHQNWLPTSGINVKRLRLFRQHKVDLILAKEFGPIFDKLQFLDSIEDTANIDILLESAGKLIRIVRVQEKGEYYAGEISSLLAFHRFNASVSIPFGGTVPQWYLDGKNQERPKYRKQLREARNEVYSLVIEMLNYQSWEQNRSDTSGGSSIQDQKMKGKSFMESRERNQVFISYSHKDKQWLEQLRLHLSPYMRKGELSIWDDTQIKAGDNWRDKISEALSKASVAVLLVTPHFLASDFIIEHELQPLLEAAKREGLRVIWIAVSPSAYKTTDISTYQAANDPSRPLNSLQPFELDQTLVAICEKISNTTNP